MVKDIEKFGPETKPHLLGNVKLALQRNIHLRSSESPQHVAPKIALLPRGRHTESRAVENLAAGILGAIEHQRHARLYVRAWIKFGAGGNEDSAHYVNGRSRAGQNEGIQRPAPEGASNRFLRSRRRQVVGYASGKRMPDIKVRVASVYVRIRNRVRCVQIVGKGVGGGNVDRVGKGVRSQRLQPL